MSELETTGLDGHISQGIDRSAGTKNNLAGQDVQTLENNGPWPTESSEVGGHYWVSSCHFIQCHTGHFSTLFLGQIEYASV